MQKQKLSKRKIIIFLIAVIFSGIALASIQYLSGSKNHSSTPTQALGAPVPVEEPKTEVKTPQLFTPDLTSIQKDLDVLLANHPYETSVSIVDLNSSNRITSGDNSTFIAASITKLLTGTMYLEEVESGQKSLDQQIGNLPAREHLRLMINRSDNNSWELLNEELGYGNLQRYAIRNGLTSYDVKLNSVNSIDMATFMEKIYKKEIINQKHSELLYGWMKNTSEERFIPAALPKGVEVVHKAGNLTDRVHDAAIVFNTEYPFTIVVLSKSGNDRYDYIEGKRLYNQIIETVLNGYKQRQLDATSSPA